MKTPCLHVFDCTVMIEWHSATAGVLWSLWGTAFAVWDISESGCAGHWRQNCPPPGCSERFCSMCGSAAETWSLLHTEGPQAQVDGSPCCRCVFWILGCLRHPYEIRLVVILAAVFGFVELRWWSLMDTVMRINRKVSWFYSYILIFNVCVIFVLFSISFLKWYFPFPSPFLHAAAEGQMDCLLLLVNREQSADIIDSPDTQGL